MLSWLQVNLHIQPKTPFELEQEEQEHQRFSEKTKHWFMALDRDTITPWLIAETVTAPKVALRLDTPSQSESNRFL